MLAVGCAMCLRFRIGSEYCTVGLRIRSMGACRLSAGGLCRSVPRNSNEIRLQQHHCRLAIVSPVCFEINFLCDGDILIIEYSRIPTPPACVGVSLSKRNDHHWSRKPQHADRTGMKVVHFR
jgi:hypothetical protein